jgi:hypothetical protein
LLSPATPFNKILFIDTFANSSLAGFTETSIGSKSTKYVDIGALSEATAANAATAGSVGTALLADLTGVFSHSRAPTSVGVLSVDRADGGNGVDTYAAAISALVNADQNDWYCAVPVSHTLTDICDILAGVLAVTSESRPRVVFAQTSNSAAYGDSSAWTTALVDSASAAPAESSLDRLAMFYAPDTYACAAGVASWGFAIDPDTASIDWRFPVPGISKIPLPSGVAATTFKHNLRGVPGTDLGNKINLAWPFGSSNVWLDPGVMQSGRAIYVTYAADWFQARLEGQLADLQLRYATQSPPAKIPLNGAGQKTILGEIEALYLRGVGTGAFLSRADALTQGTPVVLRAEPITTEDRAVRRLRFTVSIPVLQGTRVVNIAVTVTE